MIKGIVSGHLLPMIPVSLKKLDGDWQNLNILLDTGSEVGFMLPETTASRHGIAIRLDYNSPASIVSVQRLGNSMPMSPCWVELQLEGYPRVVEAQIISRDAFSGVIGPTLLLNRRITMDIVEHGEVSIDRIPAPTALARIRSLIRKPERQWPSLEYVWKLPWLDVAIKDSRGRWRSFSANVDTGDNGALSLPPSYVEEFGLGLFDKCTVNTVDGPLNASCGQVEILWQGSPCTVQCIQRQEQHPPLIGMKLLRGNRMTIDVGDPAPLAQIARIPRSALANKGSFQSSWNRIRHRFGGRSWQSG